MNIDLFWSNINWIYWNIDYAYQNSPNYIHVKNHKCHPLKLNDAHRSIKYYLVHWTLEKSKPNENLCFYYPTHLTTYPGIILSPKPSKEHTLELTLKNDNLKPGKKKQAAEKQPQINWTSLKIIEWKLKKLTKTERSHVRLACMCARLVCTKWCSRARQAHNMHVPGARMSSTV